MHILPIFSTLITFAFAASVLLRWRHKRPLHLLFWGLGLALYGLGTLSEVILGFTFSVPALKLWYLSGAMLTAAWLGQGTVFLLIRKQGIAKGLMGLLLALSLISLALVFLAPITSAASAYNVARPVSEQYKDILVRSGLITTLTILLNIYATLTLVGGAIYSAFLFWRKRILADRMLGNLLIAGGALFPAMAGSLVKAGLADWLYLSELLGASLMFLGFMLATRSKPAERPATVPA